MTGDRLSLDALKRALRPQALAARRAAHALLAADAGGRLAEAFLLAGLGDLAGAVVAGYWPMGEEADVRPLLARLAGLGRVTALPVVVARHAPLEFRPWRPDAALEAGPHGTRHPPPSAGVVLPDVVLVPLLAFDRRGGRLGYGGGYYDRTLEALRAARAVTVVGVGYAAQGVEAVPSDGHDQRMDWILTETGAMETLS